jgi:hypothetical protein
MDPLMVQAQNDKFVAASAKLEKEQKEKFAERYAFLRESLKQPNGIVVTQAFIWESGGSRRHLDHLIDNAIKARDA